MRPLLIALLVMSCASDEPRRPSEPREPIAAVLSPSPAPPPAPVTVPSALAAKVEPPAVAAASPREATRRAAHDALASYCGECHEGHRSSNAKALAVFDLDKPDWPSRFDEHRSESALRRLSSKSPAARDAFIAFRDAERAGAPPAVSGR